MLIRAKESYRSWHNELVNLKRVDQYTIGEKIDETFLLLLELTFRACFASNKLEKLSYISAAITKSDILKFLLQLAWEQKILNHKKYGEFILDLDEVGRMLGGWKKKTPAR